MSVTVGETFAGYTILRLLGSGGMGEVYLAQHPRLPRKDALKVLSADVCADADYRARFAREADLASTLWHPNIVSVHDRGEDDGQLWLSMDYVEGLDAAHMLATNSLPALRPKQVENIVTAVADALDHAHDRGLLHRDIKPANIMITSNEQRILLADFGIVHRLNDISGLTATNFTVGTVAYAAPEQLMGEELDGRADQYALAATAYHLLTGSHLFPNSNPAVVIGRHLTATPPALSDSRPELAALDPVFAIALAKNPDDRFPKCSDFADAFASARAKGGTGHTHLNQTATLPAINTKKSTASATPVDGAKKPAKSSTPATGTKKPSASRPSSVNKPNSVGPGKKKAARSADVSQRLERSTSPTNKWRWAAIAVSAVVAISGVVYYAVNSNDSSGGSATPPTTTQPSPSFTSVPSISTTPAELTTSAPTGFPPAPLAAPDVGRITNAVGGFSFALPAGWVESDASHLDYGSAMLSKTTGQPSEPGQLPPVANDTRIVMGRLDKTVYASAEANDAKAAVRLGSDMGEYFMPYPGMRINQDGTPLTGANGFTGSASYYEVKFSDPAKPNGQIWTGVIGSDAPNAATSSPPQRWFIVYLGTANDPVDKTAAKTLAESIRPN
ncbi:MAG: APA family fibronectin-binding glycoprotein [Mycobacterium sp.]|uniref:APA family fibronectin-binding glycoprotein n=1 Tax=Mycobacterium sp. TaxID=1785 RepID=UPI003F987726